jgi:hypothetical protein
MIAVQSEQVESDDTRRLLRALNETRRDSQITGHERIASVSNFPSTLAYLFERVHGKAPGTREPELVSGEIEEL